MRRRPRSRCTARMGTPSALSWSANRRATGATSRPRPRPKSTPSTPSSSSYPRSPTIFNPRRGALPPSDRRRAPDGALLRASPQERIAPAKPALETSIQKADVPVAGGDAVGDQPEAFEAGHEVVFEVEGVESLGVLRGG